MRRGGRRKSLRNLAILILCSLASLAQAQTSSGYSVPNSGTGLTVFIGSGTTTTTAASIVTWAGGLVNVTANAATYIYVDSTGHVTTSTNTTGLTKPSVCDSGFASQSFPIAKVTANFFQVQTVIDCRTTFNLAGAGTGAITSVFGRTGAITATAGDYTWDQIGAGSNLLSQTMGSGGNFSPLNIGQVAGSQMWLAPGLSSPTVTNANGGSWLSGHTAQIAYTFVSASGQTLASVINSNSVQNFGACTNNCILTITAPTIPSGYTGYTAYMCDSSSGPCTLPVQVPSCINITTNCSVSAPVTSGTAMPTINAAWVQPPNVQSGTVVQGAIPSGFFPRDDGKYYPFLMVDWNPNDNDGFNAGNGTPMITNQLFMNDNSGTIPVGNQTQAFKNAFFSITHTFGVQTVANNQDRTIGCLLQNPAGDSTTRFGGSCIQAETDIQGTGGFNGSPDGEVAAGSFQGSDAHTNTAASVPALGIHAVRAQQFIAANAGSWNSCAGVPCVTGLQAFLTDLSTSSPGTNAVAAILARAWNAATAGVNRQGYGIYLQSPTSSGRFSSNYGLYVEPWTNGSTNRADRSFFFDGSSATYTKGVIAPTLYVGGGMVSGHPVFAQNWLDTSGTASIGIVGSPQVTGSISTAQIGTVTNVTDFSCNVTGGSGTSYTYTVVGVDGNGQTTAGTSTCVVSAAATLNVSNTVTLSLKGSANFGNGYVRYDVYRTASSGTPNTTGFIGTIPCNIVDIENFINNGATLCSLTDNGLAASGTTPAVNTTGGITDAADLTFTTGKGQHINTQAAANDISGTVGVASSTTASVSFTRNYTATPVCVLTPQTTGLTSWYLSAISSSGFTVTVAPSGTYTFGYLCAGNPN